LPRFQRLTISFRKAHGLASAGVRAGQRRAAEIAKVEQSDFDSVALLEVLKNPMRRFLGKPALTRTATITEIVFMLGSFWSDVFKASVPKR